MAWGRSMIGVSVLIASVIVGGCAGTTPPGEPTAATNQQTMPQAPPLAAPLAPQIGPVPGGTVAATGSFTGEYGITGEVRVVRADDSWWIEFVDLKGSPEEASVYAIARSEIALDGCPLEFQWFAGIGNAPLAGDEQIQFPPIDRTFEDPSYLSDVAIQIPGEVRCGSYGFARAPLAWTLPDLRPDLEPVDAGPREGARGVAAEGVYLVAAGDTEMGILDRFGLSFDDLVYLNPTADHVLRADFPWADCTVNVSKETRPRITECR